MHRPRPLRVMLTVEQLWQPVPGGSGTYIRELTAALAARNDVTIAGLAARHRESTPRLSPDVPTHHSTMARGALYALWSRSRATWIAPGVGRPRPDVLHATTWAIPPRVAPLVVTVHDLAFVRDPSHFTAHGNRYFRRALSITRDEADLVVVPSEATAADCVEQGIARSRIRVVPHGVRVPDVPGSEIETFRRAHGLERPYVLWTGTLEPRKNLPTLLEAFRAVAAARDDLDLVLVGPTGWGGTAEQVDASLGALPADRVHRLGRVDHDDLHRAYAGAHVFCYPSTWEGFGLPVLEAMAHGVPVVTSAGTSMAEVCGSDALLVDPGSPDALAEAVLAASDRHDDLAAAGRVRAAGFTWQRSAELHVDAYRAAAG